jgi:hypothetical protein
MSSAETPPDPSDPEPTDEQMNTAGLIFLGNVILLIIAALVLLPR